MKEESLKFKSETRQRLYRGQFKYKINFKLTNNTIRRAISRNSPVYVIAKNPHKLESALLTFYTTIFNARQNNYDGGGKERSEYGSLSIFTNDYALCENFVREYEVYIQSSPKIQATVIVYEADIMPDGIKYFSRTPPAAFRTYIKSVRFTNEEKVELLNFLSTTKGLRPSPAFQSWLTYESRYGMSWSRDNFFIDYDNDGTSSYLYLMYPEYIGKTYQLEKKPLPNTNNTTIH